MKKTNKLSLATLVVTGVFATGCSSFGGSDTQIEAATQIEAPVAVVAAPRAAPAPQPVMKKAPVRRVVKRRPVKRYNRWGHTHPAIPRCTKSIRHTHKYNRANHSHKYSCQRPARRVYRKAAPRRAQATPAQKVDVYALQRKLKAKGYYRGPIDGIVGPGTRSALQRFMKR